MFLLGYIPTHNRIYLADKDMNVAGFTLALSVVEYQTAVLRGDSNGAAAILPTVPKDQRNRLARFLEAQGQRELALTVTSDPDHKFELSLALDDLDAALEIAKSLPGPEGESKWRSVGDRALSVWRFDLARECFERAGDLGALVLLYTATGEREKLAGLAETARE